MLHKENKKRYILRFPTDFQKKHVTEVHYMLHNEKKNCYILRFPTDFRRNMFAHCQQSHNITITRMREHRAEWVS